jgi:hypothetical protein
MIQRWIMGFSFILIWSVSRLAAKFPVVWLQVGSLGFLPSQNRAIGIVDRAPLPRGKGQAVLQTQPQATVPRQFRKQPDAAGGVLDGVSCLFGPQYCLRID